MPYCFHIKIVLFLNAQFYCISVYASRPIFKTQIIWGYSKIRRFFFFQKFQYYYWQQHFNVTRDVTCECIQLSRTYCIYVIGYRCLKRRIPTRSICRFFFFYCYCYWSCLYCLFVLFFIVLPSSPIKIIYHIRYNNRARVLIRRRWVARKKKTNGFRLHQAQKGDTSLSSRRPV